MNHRFHKLHRFGLLTLPQVCMVFGAKMRPDQTFKPANAVNRNLREGNQ